MAAKPWLKLYTEILEDPKMGRLSDRLFRRVIEIFLLARKTSEDGSLPSVSDMAWSFRIPEAEMLADLQALDAPGVEIVFQDQGIWYVTNFQERQDEVSASAERVRKFRDKKQREIQTSETEKEPELISVDELMNALHETNCNVTETLHVTTLREEEEKEKEEETEGEKSREESPARALSTKEALMLEIDVAIGVAQGKEAVPVIQELIKLGAEPEDIRAAAEWFASKGKTIRKADQLLGPVKTAILQRKQSNKDRFPTPVDARKNTVEYWLGVQT